MSSRPRISAPHKVYVSLDGAGHLALVERIDEFLTALDTHVLPLAMDAGAPR